MTSIKFIIDRMLNNCFINSSSGSVSELKKISIVRVSLYIDRNLHWSVYVAALWNPFSKLILSGLLSSPLKSYFNSIFKSSKLPEQVKIQPSCSIDNSNRHYLLISVRHTLNVQLIFHY